MSLVDVQNVAFSSDLVTDKIVGVFEGSFNTNTAPLLGGYIAYTSFAHPFPRPVFTKLQVSSDQIVWRDENTGDVSAISYSTASEIFVLHNPSNGVIFYRVIAFWIDDYDLLNPAIPPTVGSKSNIYFDSNLNYQKMENYNEFTVPAGTISSTTTIPHPLGYKPNVRAFITALSGQVWPCVFGGIQNYWYYDFAFVECEVKIWSDRVEFLIAGGVSTAQARVWYRIYYDD